MASVASIITLLCKKTVLAEKKEVLLKTTYHPTFDISVNFGDSKDTRVTKCPHCGRQVEYKAFRYEFSLKKALRWPALITVVSILLFLVAIFLLAFGGWEIDPAMWYFGVWGVVGFFFGIGFLIFQVLRYLAFYTKNKCKYIFAITEGKVLGPRHLLKEGKLGASWRYPPA